MYFANRYDTTGKWYPVEPEQRARVDQRLLFDLTLYNRFGDHYYGKLRQQPNDPNKMELFKEQMTILDKLLAGEVYAAGDELTIADVALVCSVMAFGLAKFPVANYPNVKRYFDRCLKVIPELPAEECTKPYGSYFEK